MNLEVAGSLQPIIQTANLLQARKTEKTVNSMCDMCDKLTSNQVGKTAINILFVGVGTLS